MEAEAKGGEWLGYEPLFIKKSGLSQGLWEGAFELRSAKPDHRKAETQAREPS